MRAPNSNPPEALVWYGGKNQRNSSTVGWWISQMLPKVEPMQSYVEPYGGMASVLLAREKANNEVINDLDSNVATFWKVLRDEPDELERLLDATPHSRQTREEARALLKNPPSDFTDVKRTWAFIVAVGQGVHAQIDGGWKTNRAYAFRENRPTNGQGIRWTAMKHRLTCQAMRDRLESVSIENKEGAEVIEYYAQNPAAVIYADPPYSQGAAGYEMKADLNKLIDAAKDAKARILISGYANDPYDVLCWNRYEMDVTIRVAGASGASRTEVAWANFDTQVEGVGTDKQTSLFDDSPAAVPLNDAELDDAELGEAEVG